MAGLSRAARRRKTIKVASKWSRAMTRACIWESTTPLEPILKVDSGDTISYPNTWSHFLNQMQPGVPVETLAKLRVSDPGKGPHSIIGPIYVNGAEPGDVLEVRYKRIRPFDWGAVFNNPGSLGTGCWLRIFPKDR